MNRHTSLVTGASGFLGSHLALSLSRHGSQVRGGIQRAGQADNWSTSGVAPVITDLLDPVSLRSAVRGVDMVYHCAALIPGKGSPDEIWRVNVDGTRNLLDACVEAAVPRILFVSSDSIYGDRHPPEADEQTPADPEFFHEGNYPRSKWVGENLVMDYHRRGLITASVARPCFMYGPGWSTGTEILLRMARRPLQRYIAGGRARLSLGYVENIAQGIRLAGSLPAAAGEAYNLSDELAISLRQIIETMYRIKGRRHLAISLPTSLWLSTCEAIHPLAKRIAPRLAEHTDPEFVRFMSRDHVIGIRKAKEQLGYAPNIGFEEGCQRLFEWSEQPFSIL